MAALTVGLTALGVVLPDGARAGAGSVSPVQTAMYVLGKYNPTTFSATTSINAASVVGVYGVSGPSVTVDNYGVIQGPMQAIHLVPSGSTLENWGTIAGTGNLDMGVLLQNGGSVVNHSGGTISGYVGVYIGGAGGTLTNSGSISGTAPTILLVSGSIYNQIGGTVSEFGERLFRRVRGKGRLHHQRRHDH